MQLIKNRLRIATCSLLAIAGGAAAADGDTQLDAAMLFYFEDGRTDVFEPVLNLKHDLGNDQSIGVKFVVDAITGSSPNGATPTNHPQTFTSTSGSQGEVRKRVEVFNAGETPVRMFQDNRISVDLNYDRPLTRLLKGEITGHISAEKDYVSRGTTLSFTQDTPDRLTTFSVGGGANFDVVEPTGGKPEPLKNSDSTNHFGNANKDEYDGMIGITRILSRRWLMQLNFSRSRDKGYLTEPYKIVSILDQTGSQIYYRMENRPDNRTHQNVLLSSAYEFTDDVIHFSYRYYWDDWGIRSNTVEMKYRYELSEASYLEPQFRYYKQTAATFFVSGIIDGTTLPQFASSDYRLGNLQTTTYALKYGFQLEDLDGDFNIRAEYMRQGDDPHPGNAIGVQKNYDLFPAVNVFIITAGYSVNF